MLIDRRKTEELKEAEKKYKGKYNKWTGALQHISVWSREGISHSVMRLSEYNVAPSLACWKALNHLMRYLYHKPRAPIMFSRQKGKEPMLSTVGIVAAASKGYIYIYRKEGR